MARYDFRSPRLFVAPMLRPGARVPLDAAQGHYLTGVLRLQAGDGVLVFNGKDGEWQGRLAGTGKRAELGIDHQVRPQSRPGDLHYLFSPLKRARLDYMVQKAVEMGVSRLQPVMTRRTCSAMSRLLVSIAGESRPRAPRMIARHRRAGHRHDPRRDRRSACRAWRARVRRVSIGLKILG